MDNFNLIATTAFGIESVVKREVTNLGFQNIRVLDGKVHYTGDATTIAKSNIWLRSADRIFINMGEFTATTFDELFEKTKKINWGDIIPQDANFIINGKSVKSTLYSISDCQSIVEKAIVEKLKQKYKVSWFDKTGANYKIQVSILKDLVTITIDTSGDALHKRGYRDVSNKAPIKETLAAALIQLSYFKKDKSLIDPLCGSGTIPIEAALIAKNIAPGIARTFVSESFGIIPKEVWRECRKEAHASINDDVILDIQGSDADPRGVAIAKANAKRAGVNDCITFSEKELKDVELLSDYGVIITNPPYGERIGTLEEVLKLYKEMGDVFLSNKTWSSYIITSYESFEKAFGKKADAKRKLFNGMIKTDYYQYYGEKPKKAKLE